MTSEDRHTVRLEPGIIWGGPGFFQQAVFLLLSLTIWAFSVLLTALNPVRFQVFSRWRDRVAHLFTSSDLLRYTLYAVLAAALLTALFTLLEVIIAKFLRVPIRERLEKNDHLLPVTSQQKAAAAVIILLGAFTEEVLFRAFLYMALLPIWSSWIWAAIVVSSIFAFVHTNMQGLSASLWIFITSMVLVAVIQYSSSFYFSWSLHVMMNMMNIFILPGMTRSCK